MLIRRVNEPRFRILYGPQHATYGYWSNHSTRSLIRNTKWIKFLALTLKLSSYMEH